MLGCVWWSWPSQQQLSVSSLTLKLLEGTGSLPSDTRNEKQTTACYHLLVNDSIVQSAVCISAIFSSSSKSGHNQVEENDGSTRDSEPPECDRHVYKSVLEGGDIPLQGLRALNRRHGSSSSSKGRMINVWHDRCVNDVRKSQALMIRQGFMSFCWNLLIFLFLQLQSISQSPCSIRSHPSIWCVVDAMSVIIMCVLGIRPHGRSEVVLLSRWRITFRIFPFRLQLRLASH